jgi:hypothetical protein
VEARQRVFSPARAGELRLLGELGHWDTANVGRTDDTWRTGPGELGHWDIGTRRMGEDTGILAAMAGSGGAVQFRMLLTTPKSSESTGGPISRTR